MKIHHIALYVADLEGMKNFFITYFNASANSMYRNKRTSLSTYMLSFSDGAKVEIMNRKEIKETPFDEYKKGYVHLSVSVGSKEAVDTLTARLSADGYSVLSRPRITGDGYYESSIRGMEDIILEITV